MYPILIASGIGTLVAASLIVFPEHPFYFFGPFLGIMVFFPVWILLSRKVSEKVVPILELAQRQAKAGQLDKAVETFQSALAFEKWQPFLRKQINTQVGTLYYASGKDKQAIEHLKDGYPKASQGHLILGTLLYREGDLEAAKEAFEAGIRFNKKSAILYNVLAFVLHKEQQSEAAIAVLERGLKALGSNAETEDNLTRLRANKKMNLRPFGELWYMLKFERLPGTAQGAAPVRKGFRQPPKRKKARKK